MKPGARLTSTWEPSLRDGQFRAVIDSSDDAILTKDSEGTITSWNRGAERIYGYLADEAIGRPISILVPPHRSGEEREILRRVFAGERMEHYETERVRKDGSTVVVSLTVSAVRADSGEVIAASVIARDITERRRSLDQAARLHRLTSLLSRELTPDRAIAVLLAEAVPALGASAGAVGLLDADAGEIRIARSVGYSDEAIESFRHFPASADLPMAEAVRRREPVWCESIEELEARYPLIANRLAPGSLAVIPIGFGEETMGALALSFGDNHDFAPTERAFAFATAQQAAYAIERTRLYEAEQSARQSLAFLARASEVLTESLDVEATLERLASLAVPRVADWCTVELVDASGDLRTVALAHVDPTKVEFAREIQRRYPPDPNAPTGAANVVRTGEPELYEEIPAQLIEAAAHDKEHLDALTKLGLVSAMTVPLFARGRILGALSLVAAESGRRFDARDLALAMDLAGRAAMAVDNATAYRRERDAALTLQQALLPRLMPEVPGIDVATRYRPAEAAIEVGGDWYDVVESTAGRLTVTVGDVAGHGAHSASVMGQLRIVLRAYAAEDYGPAASLARLNRLLIAFDEPQMATIFQLQLDPRSLQFRFARAGHPPALIRHSDGSVEQLAGRSSPPVGVFADASYTDVDGQLLPGETFVLYTDGLVERRGEGIDIGIQALQDLLANAPLATDPCLDAILDGLPRGEDDDVALLALRVTGS
jgi:PAS domain S-box-containing protein